ncbi:MAG: NADH-quinone oxidoreductase subunit L [Candidatus Promineifilaceae bacterium]
MEQLTGLTWLIPAPPLAAFFIIILFLRRYKTISWGLAWAGIFTSLVFSWIIAFNFFGLDAHGIAEHPVQIADSVVWMPFGEYTTANPFCDGCIKMGVAVDPLTAMMLFFVPLAVSMIFVYSVGYHNWGQPKGHHLGEPNHGKEEPLFARFFAYMSLFAGAMLILTVADNLLLLFVGWEVMGLCSYLLIGFWYARTYEHDPKNPQKLPPRYASIKAFMTTRVADVVMLMGIVFFYRVFGTLNFAEALSAESLMHAADSTIMGMEGGFALGVMALLIFTGTVGKSAQWPLHVWLPNAMEGPTPVSAVIHAAAMVSAGIYLILRIFPLIAVGMHFNEGAGLTIAFIGAFTAFMAATIAVAQDDVKGVLAYSTISQLGFMVAAIGIGAYIAAAFHLMTHAFFKALLFLSSGSVIHGMEHGAEHVHDHHTDPQDMMNMGGLAEKMPRTWIAFLIGGLALSGFPLVTAGFWSKDEILADAWLYGSDGDMKALVVFITLALAALLTAFYTSRQLCLTFLGKPRTPLAEHAHESNNFMTVPLMVLAVFAVGIGWVGIPDDFGWKNSETNFFHHFVGAGVEHTIDALYVGSVDAHGGDDGHSEPADDSHGEEEDHGGRLVALASVALADDEPTDDGHGTEDDAHAAADDSHAADDAHGDDAHGDDHHIGVYVAHQVKAPPFNLVPLLTSIVVALGGLGGGWLMYGRKPLKAGEPDPLVKMLGPLHTFLLNKWYWDELYMAVLVRPVTYFSETIVYHWIDKGLIDGTIHIVANAFYTVGAVSKWLEELIFDDLVDAIKDGFLWVSREFRSIQTGKIQEYALLSTFLAVALAVVVLAAYVFRVLPIG